MGKSIQKCVMFPEPCFVLNGIVSRAGDDFNDDTFGSIGVPTQDLPAFFQTANAAGNNSLLESLEPIDGELEDVQDELNDLTFGDAPSQDVSSLPGFFQSHPPGNPVHLIKTWLAHVAASKQLSLLFLCLCLYNHNCHKRHHCKMLPGYRLPHWD